MKELKLWEPGNRIDILAWGKSKVGKTFGAGTFPRPCFMDFDGGIATLASPDFTSKYGHRNIIYEQFTERSYKGAVVAAHNAYDDACKFFDEMMKPDKVNLFDTWVLDSGTKLSLFAQHKGVILLGTKEYGNMSKSHEAALKHGLLQPRIQDYGAERSLVEQFVDMVLSSSKHVVFICHEREQRDAEGNLIALTPMLTGQSTEAVPLRFSEVYNIQAKKGKTTYDKESHLTTTEWLRICQTTPDGVRVVGSRNGVPDGTEWTYDAIHKALTDAHAKRVKEIAAQSTQAA